MVTQTASTCPYCGVGCGVLIETTQAADGSRSITDVKGDPAHPANFGKLCSKGRNLHLTAAPLIAQQARLGSPMIRAQREQALHDSTWEQAQALAVEKFARIIETHGPDAVAFYVSGQLLTEDYYAFNKLAKGLIGTNNIDTNSRLCMSSAVAGYKASLGADAPPACYDDVDQAQVLFIIGSNTAWAHPVLYRRIEAAKAANPALQIIVVDPRRTDTAQGADVHLPILPGSDVALLNAMLHQMLWDQSYDADYVAQHTTGFQELRDSVRDCTPSWAERLCGIPAEKIVSAARLFAQGPTLSLYCQGMNQATTGASKNSALINLHLVTGQIGKPGAGPLSLTGQPNAMGGREVGGMANLLSAHRDMANAEHLNEVARLWGLDEVPSQAGKTAVEMFDALANGSIKAVWIACTNPANSMPDLGLVHAALRKAEFVVVQESFRDTATVDFADVVLPATTWGEKDGTVTNSERRISRVRPALAPFQSARHDWQIAVDFANALAHRLGKSAPSFNYPDARSLWEEHRESSRGRDLDITGLSYDVLETLGPQQWPMPQGAKQGRARLYTDGQFPTPSGRARLVVCAFKPTDDKITATYPFMLTTGRQRDQWHCMSRSGLSTKQFKHAPEPVLEMNANDMARRQLVPNSLVRARSKRGQQYFAVQASESLRSGQAFLSMHWGPEYLLRGGVNMLTNSAFDPLSKQPELKACAVEISPAHLPFCLSAFGFFPADQALQMRAQLRQWLKHLMPDAEYLALVPFQGHQEEGVLLQIASSLALPKTIAQDVIAQFGLANTPLLAYADASTGQLRSALVVENKLRFVLLQGRDDSRAWLREMLEQGQDISAIGSRVLLASSHAPSGFKARANTVCNCMAVTSEQITQSLAQCDSGDIKTAQLHVQTSTGCGTQCGSCVPELKGLVTQHCSAKRGSHASA
jgi:assimilatory nitrate reductase catalytic subunit